MVGILIVLAIGYFVYAMMQDSAKNHRIDRMIDENKKEMDKYIQNKYGKF